MQPEGAGPHAMRPAVPTSFDAGLDTLTWPGFLLAYPAHHYTGRGLMSRQDEIKKAIDAHGLWKARLLKALETGKSEYTVESISADNRCDFGKWVYSVSETERDGHWKTVRELHARFHQQAGNVLGIALRGTPADSVDLMGFGSAYSKASAALTSAMMKWEEALAA